MVATDGQKLTLGDTTLTLYITPGHTLGTISTLIPVKDNGHAARGGRMGRHAMLDNADAANAGEFCETYIASAERFRDIVAKAGADVLISNHTIFDGSKTKLPALASRRPAIRIRTSSVVTPRGHTDRREECAKAALASLK